MTVSYYTKKLNSEKLFQVYHTKLPRIKQYLDAEINYVRINLKKNERVLEIGAGYGRIMKELAESTASIVGVDISLDNVAFGKEYLKDFENAELYVMDAHDLEFKEKFDVVLCLQNGLSAVKGDPNDTIRQALGVLKKGGRAYFSTYSKQFWDHRVSWFMEQAEKGLLGELDMEKTKDGVIICKDGFKAVTHSPKDFEEFGQATGSHYKIFEIDESSLFLLIEK